MLTEDARLILGAWRERLVSDSSVVSWADRIIESRPPEDLPEWLLDLSVLGPARCMARPSAEFLYIPFFSFLENFAVRAGLLDLEAPRAVEAFVEWISHAAMGEDLNVPEVKFGYYVEHLLSDDSLDLAVYFVRKELPSLREPADGAQKVLLELARAT